ncbi:MAG: MarR family transcriptional regulator, partial [Tenericutes bacterium HGW-Tenericutes-8]
NPSEFGALEALYHKGKLTVQQITEKVLIANSSMTYVLDNLVKRGLITRTKDEIDRRIYVVDLTTEGKAFMDDIYPKHHQNMTSVLSCLSKEEEKTLQLLLKKIGLGAKNCKCD